MKNIMIDGRIGANGAEVRQTKGGKPYVRFSVANNSFANGQEKTEWYDVTSYDPFIIEHKAKYLTKGTFVIITGTPNVEVNVDRNGKVWLNQYVTASTIDTPSFKKKDDDSATSAQSTVSETMSTFTGGTASSMTIPKPTVAEMAPQVVIPTSEPAVVTVGAVGANAISIDDDLPF